MKEKGYMTLVNVIIVGALALAVAISLLVIGINSYDYTYNTEKSIESKVTLDSCGEMVLSNLMLDTSYTGSENMTINGHICVVAQRENNVDGTVSFDMSVTVDDLTRRSRLTIDELSPIIQIGSWIDIPSF